MLIPDYLNQIIHSVAEFFTLDPNEPFKTGAKLVGICTGILGVGTTLATKTYPWLKTKADSRSISKRVGATLFTPASIERAIRHYIPPFCQSIDPAGGEESRLIHSVQESLFGTLDRALSPSSDKRYHILFADSGMGKTSALINYYARHVRRWRKKFQIVIIPLGIPDADERIKSVENKADTALFLDALDEDTRAIKNHAERLDTILNATHEFLHVLITCRTQFFSKDEEMPRQTGVLKFGARRAGEPAEHFFYKIYLSPFSDSQVLKYIKRRYPLWRWRKRRQALSMVSKIPHLSARPMLLSHIDELIEADRVVRYSFELYEEMIRAWIRREEGFIKRPDDLRQFSERLAVDLYRNRATRGAERITKSGLSNLARQWNIQLDEWELSGRSLLNRDAAGNYKFAHRSIMEYLFVKRFVEGEAHTLDVEWTDQMKRFLAEMLEKHLQETGTLPFQDPQSESSKLVIGRARLGVLQDVAKMIAESVPEWSGEAPPGIQTLTALCALITEIRTGEKVSANFLRVASVGDETASGTGDTDFRVVTVRPVIVRVNPTSRVRSFYAAMIPPYPVVTDNVSLVEPALSEAKFVSEEERLRQFTGGMSGEELRSTLVAEKGRCMLIPVENSSGQRVGMFTATSDAANAFDMKLARRLHEILAPVGPKITDVMFDP
jgi:hypothetical protein